MNTNIIDDKDSVMGKHKDPTTTPTPALVTGPGDYIFDEEKGEWTLSYNGGRLYWQKDCSGLIIARQMWPCSMEMYPTESARCGLEGQIRANLLCTKDSV